MAEIKAPVLGSSKQDVALEAEVVNLHATLHRLLPEAGAHRAPAPLQRPDLCHVHGNDLAHATEITLSTWRATG